MSVNTPLSEVNAPADGACFNCSKDTYTLRALVRTNQRAVSQACEEKGDDDGTALKRVLSWRDLIAYGISATIGAGIFVVTGQVAQETAGPAIVLSFMIAAFSSLLSAFCYSEFAARVPLSGSAYTFSYVTLGELVGWFIGWNLTLEYAISASAVARSWSGYVNAMFESFGVEIPDWLYAIELNSLFIISPLSGMIVILCTAVLLLGVKESAMINNIMTLVNITIILFVIIAGTFYVNTDNWKPFNPYGFQGVMHGAGTVFFSYIGFDGVTTLAGEVANPTRDLPIGIVGTLGIVTALYVATSLVITGMVPYLEIDLDAPLSKAFSQVGNSWASIIVAVGSSTTLTATTFASLLGQPRIFYQMAKDGLLFGAFERLSANNVPMIGTVVSGAFACVFALVFPLSDLTEMISIGTLMAFAVVCAGVLVLRYQNDEKPAQVPALIAVFFALSALSALAIILAWPWWAMLVYALGPIVCFISFFFLKMRTDIPKTFQCPLVPLVPCVAMYINLYLILSLPPASFLRLLVWTALGMAIYFGYGIRYSRQGLWERDQLTVADDEDPRLSVGSKYSDRSATYSGKLY